MQSLTENLMEKPLGLYFLYTDEFGERCLGNLVNFPTFCKSCDLACEQCRTTLPSFAGNIKGVNRLPKSLPPFVETPEDYLPKNMPEADIILAIGIHPDLLSALPYVIEKTNAKAVIVPIEDPTWAPLGLKNQVKQELDELGIENEFPKPFCDLKGGTPLIDEFIKRFRVGQSKLEIEIANGLLKIVRVLRSTPCGLTYYVATRLRDAPLELVWLEANKKEEEIIVDLEAVQESQYISKNHHSYPCTASMIMDPELEDTILHKSGYLIRDAVREALELDAKRQGKSIEELF